MKNKKIAHIQQKTIKKPLHYPKPKKNHLNFSLVSRENTKIWFYNSLQRKRMHNKLFRFVTILEIPCNLCAENFGNYVLDLELRLHNKMSNFGFKEGRKHFHKKRGTVAVKSKIQSDKIHCTFLLKIRAITYRSLRKLTRKMN